MKLCSLTEKNMEDAQLNENTGIRFNIMAR